MVCLGCWDAEVANYSKCGPPTAPQNLIVAYTLVSGSDAMMSISWKPPVHYNPNITAYKIEIKDIEINDTRTCIIGARYSIGNDSSSCGQTTCQYIVTLPVEHKYDIGVC